MSVALVKLSAIFPKESADGRFDAELVQAVILDPVSLSFDTNLSDAETFTST